MHIEEEEEEEEENMIRHYRLSGLGVKHHNIHARVSESAIVLCTWCQLSFYFVLHLGISYTMWFDLKEIRHY